MKYIVTFLLLLALIAGCGQKQQIEQKTQQQPQKVEKSKFHLADLDATICPGCGMVFKTDSDIADTLHYGGKVYGFCSTKCEDAFKANPDKMIASLHERMEKMKGMHKENEQEEEHEEMEHEE